MNENFIIKPESRIFDGIPASPGIAIGHAFIYDEATFWVEEKDITADQIEREKRRFGEAIESVISDIRELKDKIEEKVGKEEASIFEPHIMLLQDPAVIKETHDKIEECKNAEFAFFRTTRKITKAYKRVNDPYLRQRIDDITDILRRVYTKLQGKEHVALMNLKYPVIVVAKNLSPSDTANMHTGNVLAFVTDLGGITSHATILARSLGIPAVLGVKTASSDISPGDMVVVDGGRGKVYVNPEEDTIARIRRDKERIEEIKQSLLELRDLPAITTDGKTMGMYANIEFPDEVPAVLESGAEGIGLYRSEYHFLRDDKIPSEEDLFTDYLRVAENLAPKSLIIRTFDLGGDKISHSLPVEHEENPFLGWRAIRVSLSMKSLFKSHLRAIMRASVAGNVRIMFPMISSMDELDEALECIEEVKSQLLQDGYDFDHNIPVGIMIEIPSAVMIAEHLARKVSFFSIGTNDLIQYSVAVDRTNDRIANLFDVYHPGVWKLVKKTVDDAHAAGITVAVCGELSNDPAAALLFLGLGVDELSMAPTFIPTIKHVIRSISVSRASEMAAHALSMESGNEVKKYLAEEMKRNNIH